jgi:hypothetical protein
VWIFLNKPDSREFIKATKEIDSTLSDRAAAIVAAAFVEDHLTAFLKSTFVQEPSLLKELFRPSGPLGFFSTKIDLGYLNHKYSRIAWKELHKIREIRNAFAHKMEVDSFEYERINAISDNLLLWKRKKIKITAKGSKKENRLIALTFDEDVKEGEREVLLSSSTSDENHSIARQIFTNSCKFYVAAFSIILNFPPGHEPPLL